MLFAMKKRTLEWAAKYEAGQLSEPGLDGVKEMTTACSNTGSAVIDAAIVNQGKELDGFIKGDVQDIRAIPNQK